MLGLWRRSQWFGREGTGRKARAVVLGLFLKNLDESRVTETDSFSSLLWLLAPRAPFSGANVLILRPSGGSIPTLVGRNCGFRR